MRQMLMPLDDQTSWQRLLSRLSTAVDFLGLKEVAFKLDVAASTLSNAKQDKNDRRWAQEWTLTILEMLADRYDDTANEIARAIVHEQAQITRRFEVVAIDDETTDAEIAAAERVVSRLKKRRRAT
jgi:hypothetical protein